VRARRPDLRFGRRAVREEALPLPVSLEIGDKVLIEGTGAYTTTYSPRWPSTASAAEEPAARMRGHGAILLVGDAPYYGRFGFSAEKTASLAMPGAYQQDRLLGLELQAGALDGASGTIGATGRFAPKPGLGALAATASRRAVKSPTSHAA
jgi:hypothetical protein